MADHLATEPRAAIALVNLLSVRPVSIPTSS